jgi:lipopolysaccharide export system permease protein
VLFQTVIARYFARQYLIWFFSVFAVFVFLIGIFDVVELLRRSSGKDDVTIGLVLQMSALKMPLLIQDLAPFIVLISAMLAFWWMAKANELVIARSAGLSPWQIIGPVISIALIVGVVQVCLLNPLAARLNAQFERIETEYLRRQDSQLALAKSGFWLRQTQEDEVVVLHGGNVSGDDLQVTDVMVLIMDRSGAFLSRIDAESAYLTLGAWEIRNAWVKDAEGRRTFAEIYDLPTDMTVEKIRESFASADTISFWDLPGFIDTLRKSGFSAVEHRLRLHSLLSTPLLFCAMVLAAAIFSLRANRRSGAAYMIVGGISIGFVFFFVTRIVHAIGLSTEIPVVMAAWSPAIAMSLFGLATLLHLEDG